MLKVRKMQTQNLPQNFTIFGEFRVGVSFVHYDRLGNIILPSFLSRDASPLEYLEIPGGQVYLRSKTLNLSFKAKNLIYLSYSALPRMS